MSPPPTKIGNMKTLSRNAIAQRYKVDYSTAFGWTKMPNFPASIGKRKHGALAWNANDVYAWVSNNRPHNRIVKVITTTPYPALTEPVIQPAMPAGKSTLDVILFLLENDKDKQKLVLDLLLD
jgi:hypothetical protein